MVKKYFSFFCLAISLLSLIYIFYRSQIYWGGQLKDYYYFYYKISVFLILFSIVTFFLNEKIKTYLIIVIFSVIFSIYLYEGYLTFKDTIKLNKKINIYKKETGKDFDTRTIFEVYDDLKENYNNLTFYTRPFTNIKHDMDSEADIFNLSGKSNSKTLFCNENGYFSIYDSDRYGFNNPDKEWDNKKIEYIVLGDSYLHGACVNRPDDISSVLRELSKKSVLNLGMSDNGPLLQFASLREYFSPNTKNILWFYFEGNDIEGLNMELKSEILTNYLTNENYSQNLKSRQNEIDRKFVFTVPSRKKIGLFDSKIFKFIKLDKLRYKIKIIKEIYRVKKIEKFANKKEIYSNLKQILIKTQRFTLKHDSKLYFIYLPDFSRYIGHPDNEQYNKVKSIVEELDIIFIDVHKEIFQKSSRPLVFFPFEMYGHYTLNAYREIAKLVYKITK